MRVFHIERLNVKEAVIIGWIGFAIGVWLISLIGKLLFGTTFFHVVHSPIDTPATRWEIYQALIESGEVVNGTIVDVVKLGDVLITYRVKTPTLQAIQRSYKTSLTRYSREDIGKEVAVLYLNETVNVLL